MNVKCKCGKCGIGVEISMSEKIFQDELCKNALIKFAVCSECERKQEITRRQLEIVEKAARKKWENSESYKKRLKESMLEHYHLCYDVGHPGANQGLFDWMGQHKNESVVIPGNSGECKSRIVIHYAYEKLNEGLRVLYFPCPDLLDRIGSAFRTEAKGERFFDWIMSFDLLIIDEILRDAGSPKGIQRLWQIIDRRYVQTDQKRNIESGKWSPMYIKGKDRRHGWQLWVIGNGSSNEIEYRFSNTQKAGGKAVTRRLNEIGEIWKG